VEDTRPPDQRYQPGHPDADAQGYVSFPHISPPEEMVDLMDASRNFEANTAAIAAVKDMISKSIDLLKI
jgi:flagellar basal-body rod protein FlgC